MKEIDIIIGLRNNQLKAQKLFYDHFGPALMGVCFRYMPNKEMAEEVFHDGMLKVYEKINKFEDKGSFKGWCRRLMVNTCLDQLRKDKDHLKLLHIEDNELEIKEVDNLD